MNFRGLGPRKRWPLCPFHLFVVFGGYRVRTDFSYQHLQHRTSTGQTQSIFPTIFLLICLLILSWHLSSEYYPNNSQSSRSGLMALPIYYYADHSDHWIRGANSNCRMPSFKTENSVSLASGEWRRQMPESGRAWPSAIGRAIICSSSPAHALIRDVLLSAEC